jgi:long-chain acyl-CoA synthetase
VPRLLEKAHAEIRRGLAGQPWHVRWLAGSLLGLRAALPFAPVLWATDRLLVARLRRAVWGPAIRFLLSGSAPVDPRILRFFAALGVPTCEVYGLSEIAVIVTTNRPGRQRYGSVGAPLPGMDVRLAPDGEILVRTPAAFEHYWGEARNGHFTEEGYLRTGDLGRMAHGHLYITGRKKEIIKTSTGQRISPVEVERNYRDIAGVEQFVVVGNGRKHLGALVAVGEGFVSRSAAAGESPAARLRREIEKRHGNLAGWQQVKRFALLPRPLSVDEGELTPLLKVRRMEVERRYRQVIDAMYGPEAV